MMRSAVGQAQYALAITARDRRLHIRVYLLKSLSSRDLYQQPETAWLYKLSTARFAST